MSKGAKAPGVPFAWQDKRVLRRIREQCVDPASALGVYVALTVAASDQQCEEFQTTHNWIASASGFSERTVRRRLADLEQIGAVSITTPTMRAPCTYRLLPLGHDGQTFGHGVRAFGHGEGTSVAVIRRKEEKKVPPTPFSEEASLKAQPNGAIPFGDFKTLRKSLL